MTAPGGRSHRPVQSLVVSVLRDVVTSPERRAEYLADGRWDDTHLSGRLSAAAAEHPDKAAVVDLEGNRVHTFAQLDADASKVAGILRQAGFQRGNVATVQLPNWYETVAIDLGILRAGGVLNPVLPVYRYRELEHVMNTGGVTVLFAPDMYRGFDHAALAVRLRQDVGSLDHTVVVPDPTADPGGFRRWLDGTSAVGGADDLEAGDVSELIFTSGTEAAPKAVMHTEQTANFSMRAAASSLGLTESDVVWMPSPIGHSTGFNYGVRMSVYHGLTLVLQDRWDPGVAGRLIEAHQCSYSLAATTFASDLVAQAAADGSDLSSLRLFGSGGATVPPEVVVSAGQVGVDVLRLYGSTEVLVATWNPPGSPAHKRHNTDGCVVDGVEVMVVGDDGEAAIGIEGEILVRGPNTCVGFFDDPARVASTFGADGWVRSGDLGVLDADGYLTVVGRKKEIIIRGGLNIAPREIEEMLLQLPAVEQVAVVGLPDDRLGEIACACVVTPDDHLTLDALVSHMKSLGAAAYKLPERFVRIDSLPMTLTGKVQKFELVRSIVDAQGSS